MAERVRNHTLFHVKIPSVTGRRLLVNVVDVSPQTGGGDDHRVLVIVPEELLHVSQHTALVNLTIISNFNN